ncbi:hypothetical protein BZA77DRAFT_296652 [Pyronema omphalodes]|nr:hypothetical protein BZA77DRAFT_296652 [Pyronema omphalodes]
MTSNAYPAVVSDKKHTTETAKSSTLRFSTCSESKIVLFTDRAKHSREDVLRISNYFQYGGRNRFQLVRIIATENGKLGTHDVEDAHILVHDVSILSKRGTGALFFRAVFIQAKLKARATPYPGRLYYFRTQRYDHVKPSGCPVKFLMTTRDPPVVYLWLIPRPNQSSPLISGLGDFGADMPADSPDGIGSVGMRYGEAGLRGPVGDGQNDLLSSG